MTTNNTIPHPGTGRELSKLDRYALAPYMTTDQVEKTSDEVIGVLKIGFDKAEDEPTQAEIDTLIEEEVDRYLVYRYIELLFLTKLINITIVGGVDQTAKLRHQKQEVDLMFVTDENLYNTKKIAIESPEYQGSDMLLAYMPQATIDIMRKEIEAIIQKKNKGTKSAEHFVQEAFPGIPSDISKQLIIQFTSPSNPTSLATQLIEQWFSITPRVVRQRVIEKSPRKK